MPGWEFLDDDGDYADTVERTLTDDSTPGRRRWLRAGAAVAAVALAVGIGLRPSSHPSPSAQSPHRSSSVKPAPVRDLGFAPTATETVLNIVSQREMHDLIRPDGARHTCPDVRPGTVPQRRIASVLRQNLPGFRVTGGFRVLDEWAELCLVVVRARDSRGTTVVLRVSPPQPGRYRDPGYVAVQTGFQRFEPGGVQYATSVTRRGWAITVGSYGPDADTPSSSALVRIVQYEKLTW